MNAKPKPIPTTPHELCKRLTELGDSFWIERRKPGSFGEFDKPEMLDIHCHGPEWVELSRQDESGRFWVRWADLGPFSIVEG